LILQPSIGCRVSDKPGRRQSHFERRPRSIIRLQRKQYAGYRADTHELRARYFVSFNVGLITTAKSVACLRRTVRQSARLWRLSRSAIGPLLFSKYCF
jgi:hypothetical protein